MTDKDSEQISDGHVLTVSNISKCNLLLSTNELTNENVSCETTVNDEKMNIIPSLEQTCSQGGDDGVCGELDEITMDTDLLTEESQWASVDEKCKNVFNKKTRRKTLKAKNKIQELSVKSANGIQINSEQFLELKTQLEDIETYKCKGAILRSKSQWAIESDRNTAYF
ncbi:unnamed protein product [Mytilus coruscus]|uniref:Uncharacterized protein n=1 Tax=Mytilus coruscus TaxID=42192 RepID=A0A6J8E5T2_MYTCO|nr:unnamed protein product [Mytilus coruscus]